MSNKIVDLLDATIDVLQANGWARGSFKTKAGELCLLEAWRNVPGSGLWPSDLFYDVVGTDSVLNWNDRQAEDRHEVISVLLSMRNRVAKCK